MMRTRGCRCRAHSRNHPFQLAVLVAPPGGSQSKQMTGGTTRAIEFENAVSMIQHFVARDLQHGAHLAAQVLDGEFVRMKAPQQAKPFEYLRAQELLGTRRAARNANR